MSPDAGCQPFERFLHLVRYLLSFIYFRQVKLEFPLSALKRLLHHHWEVPRGYSLRSPAGPADLQAIADLLNKDEQFGVWSPRKVDDEIMARLVAPDAASLLFCQDRLVGFAATQDQTRHHFKLGLGMWFIIDPEHRGRRLAYPVWYRTLSYFAREAYQRVIFTTDPFRIPVLSFYLGTGAKPVCDSLWSFVQWKRIRRAIEATHSLRGGISSSPAAKGRKAVQSDDENQKLERVVNTILRDRRSVVLLEAGCGSANHITLDNSSRTIGIDLSYDRIKRNSYVKDKLVGDLGHYPFKVYAFDAIVCWDVLEHLEKPVQLLEDFYYSLNHSGILILAFPNILSWKGLVTKITPFCFHKCFYRYVFGDEREKEFDQFPTHLRTALEPERFRRFAKSLGFSEEYYRLYEGPVQVNLRKLSPVMDVLFCLMGLASRFLSLGRVDLNLSDCLLVLMKE